MHLGGVLVPDHLDPDIAVLRQFILFEQHQLESLPAVVERLATMASRLGVYSVEDSLLVVLLHALGRADYVLVYDLITRYEIRTLHALKYAISHRSIFQKLQMRHPVVVDDAGINSSSDSISNH